MRPQNPQQQHRQAIDSTATSGMRPLDELPLHGTLKKMTLCESQLQKQHQQQQSPSWRRRLWQTASLSPRSPPPSSPRRRFFAPSSPSQKKSQPPPSKEKVRPTAAHQTQQPQHRLPAVDSHWTIRSSNTQFGSFQLVELLGQGREAKVWKCMDKTKKKNIMMTNIIRGRTKTSHHQDAGGTTTNAYYAIKLLSKQPTKLHHPDSSLSSSSALLAQHLRNELQVFRHVPRHTNLVHLERVVHGPTHVGLVLECATTSVYQFRNACQHYHFHRNHNNNNNNTYTNKHPSPDWTFLVIGVLRGLQHLHQKGFCHLDIKPENLLLVGHTNPLCPDPNGVRICDFGFAQRCRSSSSTSTLSTTSDDSTQASSGVDEIPGTTGFMAPELLASEEDSSLTSSSSSSSFHYYPEADLWSLGATLLDLLLLLPHEWMTAYHTALRVYPAVQPGHLVQQLQRIQVQAIQQSFGPTMKNGTHHHHPTRRNEPIAHWLSQHLLVPAHQRMSTAECLAQPFLRVEKASFC